MATYKLDDIKHDVRVLLGENENITPLISMETSEAPGSVATERDILTESMVLSAIDNIHMVAPIELLTDIYKDMETDSADYCASFGGYSTIVLADDYLRFVSIISDEWDVPVVEPINELSEEYLMLHSRYSGVRASFQRPKAVIVRRKGKLNLETYPAGGDESYEGLYIPTVINSSLTSIPIAKKVYKAVLYNIASLYYVSIKDESNAKLMLEEAKLQIGGEKND